MPTVRGLGAAGDLLDRQMNQFAGKAKGIQSRGEKAAGAVVVAAVAANLGGRSIRMRNVGKKGAKVGVIARPGLDGTVVQMTGPAQLIERDTKAHVIPKPNRRKKSRVLLVNGDFVTGPIPHPGTKGKHPFAKGVAEAAPIVPRVFQVEVGTAMTQVFR